MNGDSRFWILDVYASRKDDVPLVTPYGDETWGVVDEEAGGVVAYFGSFVLANQYIKLRENDERSKEANAIST